jgi:hypothetical protein
VQKCFIGGGTGGMGAGTGGGTGMGTGGSGAGGAGGLNFGCLLGCFNNDVGAAFQAIQAFQCITQTCGMQCAGGLGGPGGTGGAGTGGKGAGGTTGIATDPFGGGPQPGVMTLDMGYMVDSVRVPEPAECPGYPELQRALSREPLPRQGVKTTTPPSRSKGACCAPSDVTSRTCVTSRGGTRLAVPSR